MTSRQHQDWLNHGKPDSGLVLPLQLLANALSAAGYVVYVYPNEEHLDHVPPEDHTYFSETGWPNISPKWWRHAIDIMPPARPGLPSLQILGQRIFDARQAGQITWLKYMNWPSTGDLSRAVQDSWKPNHVRSASGDTGHIHLSSITGVEVLDSSFNPLTSIVLSSSTTPGDDMSTKSDAILAAWAAGVEKGADGTPVAPVTWEIRREQNETAVNARLAAIQTTLAAQTQTIANLTSLLQQAGSPDVAPLVTQIQAMTAQLAKLADTEATQSAQIAALQAKLAAAAKAEADTLGTS